MHLLAMLCVSVAVVLLTFYYYLPHTTQHGQSITMPHLIGMHLEEVDSFLYDIKLNYEVSADSVYDSAEAPYTVRKQFPAAYSKIKQHRKIQITLNAAHPPMVQMPNLLNGSLTNALFLLEAKDLRLGTLSYVADLAENAVLKQRHKGEDIAPQVPLASGSVIDLVVGGGLKGRRYQMPRVIGLPVEKALIILAGLELRVRAVHRSHREDAAGMPTSQAGVVSDQLPRETKKVRAGDEIVLWVHESPLEPSAK